MPKFLKPLILLVVAAAAAGTFGVGQAQASKCSSALIKDWYVDGRIDQTYAVHCYREALKDIPEDQIVYGTLREDLTRALQATIRKHDGSVTGGTPVPGAGGNGPGAGSSRKDEGFFRWLARAIGPDTANSIPVPLLVLGGLALALIAAAAVSFFARRYQARRAQPPPAPPTI
jgi:hypothetical protein